MKNGAQASTSSVPSFRHLAALALIPLSFLFPRFPRSSKLHAPSQLMNGLSGIQTKLCIVDLFVRYNIHISSLLTTTTKRSGLVVTKVRQIDSAVKEVFHPNTRHLFPRPRFNHHVLPTSSFVRLKSSTLTTSTIIVLIHNITLDGTCKDSTSI